MHHSCKNGQPSTIVYKHLQLNKIKNLNMQISTIYTRRIQVMVKQIVRNFMFSWFTWENTSSSTFPYLCHSISSGKKVAVVHFHFLFHLGFSKGKTLSL